MKTDISVKQIIKLQDVVQQVKAEITDLIWNVEHISASNQDSYERKLSVIKKLHYLSDILENKI
jgi:hypothetical protein